MSKPVDFIQYAETGRRLGMYWLVLNEAPREHPRLRRAARPIARTCEGPPKGGANSSGDHCKLTLFRSRDDDLDAGGDAVLAEMIPRAMEERGAAHPLTEHPERGSYDDLAIDEDRIDCD